MELSAYTDNYDASWSPATTWMVDSGSLESSVTFESSLSLIKDDNCVGSMERDQSSTVNSTSKSALILRPPSSASTPCEITINFAQKHELRQVYVRSTARVYEIYCATELPSTSEYICTVRCGIATRDEEVLRTIDVEEAPLANQKDSTRELPEGKLRNGNNLVANEDDWVEVKVLDTPSAISSGSSLSSNSDANPGGSSQNNQDLYEATAEINDANPCMSLTLRLLSLQNKSCVYVDEVYVFAEPVDAANLDNQVGQMESSSGDSLMALLVPTLLQFSRTKGVDFTQSKQKIDGEQNSVEEIGSEVTSAVNGGSIIHCEGKFHSAEQQEMKLPEKVGPTSKQAQLETPSQASSTEHKPDSFSHIEGVLDQLVSRVNRIEDLMLRFEESMVKPISSLDDRLKRVEQQLKVFVEKTMTSELLSCTRISAPEFSCGDSEMTSSYNSGSTDLSYVMSEANDKKSSSTVLGVVPASINDTEFHPSLVVTAPDFSFCDDEEDNHAQEPAKESLKDKEKPVMSIDNALASALAGFLTSASIRSQKYSQTLAVKAPEFLNEEENDVNFKTATNELDRSECIRSSFSSLPCTSLEGDQNAVRSPNNNSMSMVKEECLQHSEGGECDSKGTCIDKGIAFSSLSHTFLESGECAVGSLNNNGMSRAEDEQLQLRKEGECDSQGSCIDHEGVMHHTTITCSHQMTTGVENGEVGDVPSDISALKENDSLEHSHGNQTCNVSDTIQEGTVLNELTTSIEITEEGYNQDTLHSIVELSHANSLVDFEAPILEVKFLSQENLDMKSPLEALLGGIPNQNVEAPSTMENENDGSQVGELCNLITVDDWGVTSSAPNGNISVDMNYYTLGDMPLSVAANEVQDYYSCDSPKSLI